VGHFFKGINMSNVEFVYPKRAQDHPERKVKITMLESARGACDGKTVKMYHEGEEHEVSESLAKCFRDLKVAKVHDAKMQQEHQNKMEKPPLNKAKGE
jgi:hypothetical protein